MEGDRAAFKVIGGDNGVMPDRRETFAEVLEDDHGVAGGDFRCQIAKACKRDRQCAASAGGSDHVFLECAPCPRREGETRNLILGDVLAGPLQRHCQCRRSTVEIRLLDQGDVLDDGLARRTGRRRQVERGCRAGRKGERGDKWS